MLGSCRFCGKILMDRPGTLPDDGRAENDGGVARGSTRETAKVSAAAHRALRPGSLAEKSMRWIRGRRRCRFGLEAADSTLERRELLSGGVDATRPAAETSTLPNLFRRNGIQGFNLSMHFVNKLNDRLTTSQGQAQRVSQAFTAFVNDYATLPVNPPPARPARRSPRCSRRLKQQVTYALNNRVVVTDRVSPSASNCRRSFRPWRGSP